MSSSQVPKKWDGEAEIIVVGGGNTGIPAAITAHDKGAKVMVLETSRLSPAQTCRKPRALKIPPTSFMRKPSRLAAVHRSSGERSQTVRRKSTNGLNPWVPNQKKCFWLRDTSSGARSNSKAMAPLSAKCSGTP
jgi:NADPH-dependent glutamate synthase beta subunit-like oxidoreductase